MNGTKTDLVKQLLRQFIEVATKALYSEQFDMESIVTRLTRGQTGIPLLRAYVAIQIAAQLSEPVTHVDVDSAFQAVHSCEAHSESPEFQDILEIHKELAELYWSGQHLMILRGKYYSQADEYSYEGMLYRSKYNNQGPLPTETQANFETLYKDLADANHRLEQKELDLLKEQDEEEYQRYREELEVLALRREIDATEDENIRLESAEVISMLKKKLDTLLQK